LIAVNTMMIKVMKSKVVCSMDSPKMEIPAMFNNSAMNRPKVSAYRLPATAWASQLIQPERNPNVPPNASLIQAYPPPAPGNAEPSSA
jgi:hypothetical protein